MDYFSIKFDFCSVRNAFFLFFAVKPFWRKSLLIYNMTDMNNRKLILMLPVLMALHAGAVSDVKKTVRGEDIQEVPFTEVHLNDSFWSPRIEKNRMVSIPSAFRECEKNGRFDNFALKSNSHLFLQQPIRQMELMPSFVY